MGMQCVHQTLLQIQYYTGMLHKMYIQLIQTPSGQHYSDFGYNDKTQAECVCVCVCARINTIILAQSKRNVEVVGFIHSVLFGSW